MIAWPIKPQNVKYSRWYYNLIVKARARTLSKETYTEKHHVIPKSFGGTDKKDNLVRLTAREHFIAHAILWKMRFEGVGNMKMVHAFNAMCIMKPTENQPEKKINNRLFEKVRLERVEYLKTLKGPLSATYGKKLVISDEGKLNKREAINALWADPERRQPLIDKKRDYFDSPAGIAQRQAHSKRVKGVPRDPDIIEKTASKKRGKKGTEIFSEQALANMREANKHRVYSEEGLAKIRETSRKNGQRSKSEEHKAKIGAAHKGKVGLVGTKNPMFGKKHSPETIAKIQTTKKLTALKNAKPKFVGPIKPKNMITFRGVNYASIRKASLCSGVPVGKIKTQIKHWGENPDAETIANIDSGKLKPPMTSWNKGSIGLQVSWNKGMKAPKFTCEYCNKTVGGKTNYIRYHHDNCKLKVLT